MKPSLTALVAAVLFASSARADQPIVLFDGKHLDGWEFLQNGWVIDQAGSMTCRMEEIKLKNGKVRMRGMGYIWTRENYGDFVLDLSYKLSAGANSGVFYRTDPEDPVQGGFEIQLLDNNRFQKAKGKMDGKKLNGAFYDCQAAQSDPARPIGQWNQLTLTCNGPIVQLDINGVRVGEMNIDRWDTPNKNPDGSANKFRTALKDLPHTGRIGFQNHGQVVWFKDVSIRKLPSREK